MLREPVASGEGKVVKYLIAIASILLLSLNAESAESVSKTATGLKRIQLVTDVSRIVPGQEITVALVMSPDTGFHLYWRGPGIVGVAPVIEWDLPEGFEPGPIEWPSPEKVDMVGIAANGYRSETWLLSKIRVPENLSATSIDFRGKVSWMVCASSCHPGIENLSLKLPVGDSANPDKAISERFRKIRSQLPPPAPADWKFSVTDKPGKILLHASVPGGELPDKTAIDFFCDDLQVDSSVATIVKTQSDGSFTLTFTRPDFGPKDPTHFSGLLFSKTGWPGVESKWVEIAIPWKNE